MIQAIRNLSLERRIVATIDFKGYYFVGTVNALTPIDKFSQLNEKYLLALINSKLLNFYFKNRFTTISLTAAFLGELRIKQINTTEQKPFIALVEKILEVKKLDPTFNTSKWENQIDVMVYHLYNLSYEEAKIIDPELSEEEYEQYAGKTVPA